MTVGGARVRHEPTFTLAGSDVTGQVSRYGVTLGQDLSGTSSHAAISGGGGVVARVRDVWYVDAGIRFLSISGPTQRTNVGRFVIGAGYRF
jgi:opacity protein-like surface antigen